MTRFAYLILIIISVISVSCSSRKNKIDKKNLIPEKDMISIMTDIHIADGLLALPAINSRYSLLDSITAYTQVIEKHGYSKEMMDKTMKYYFIEDPKKLIRIYDHVQSILSEMDSRVEKESITFLARISNLWLGKDFYSFPSLLGNDSTRFDAILPKSGYYTLTFTVTLYHDDQSVNPRPTAYTTPIDSIESGKKVFAKYINYLKDGRPHTYNLNFHIPENKIRHLRGWLYDFDNTAPGQKKHIKIENISLTYSSALV
jgi:hypothetical protein